MKPRKNPNAIGEILVVDDEVFIQNAFRLYLETIGYRVWVAEDGESALACLEHPEAAIEVVILDLVMPGAHGLELLQVFKEKQPDLEVIIATGCGSISSAIEAMRNGAFDYVTKPIVNFDEDLLKVVEAALFERRRGVRRGREATPSETHETASEALGLFEEFVALAAQAEDWQAGERPEGDPQEDGPAVALAELERYLREHLEIAAGLFFDRNEEGDFTPAQAWGGVHRVEFVPEWFSDRQLFDAVRSGRFMSFTTENLNAGLLGLEPRTAKIHPLAVHLPIHCEGRHRGALFLFFAREFTGFHFPPPLQDGQPYLLLAPLLGSLLVTLPRERRGEASFAGQPRL